MKVMADLILSATSSGQYSVVYMYYAVHKRNSRQLISRRSSPLSTHTDWYTGGRQSDSRSLTVQWT